MMLFDSVAIRSFFRHLSGSLGKLSEILGENTRIDNWKDGMAIKSFGKHRKLFAKIMPSDRSPLPNNWKKEYIIPRIFAASTIWIMLATALYGLGIYVFAVIPDIFEMPKTLEMERIVLIGTIYGALYIPGMNLYWFYLINKKEISRKSLFYKKWRP